MQHGHDVVFKESIRRAALQPRCAVDVLKRLAERLGLALFVNETLEFCDFQILTVEAQMVVEDFGENPQDSGFVFVDRSLDVDVEEDRLGGDVGATDDFGVQHGVVKFVFQILHCRSVADVSI